MGPFYGGRFEQLKIHDWDRFDQFRPFCQGGILTRGRFDFHPVLIGCVMYFLTNTFMLQCALDSYRKGTERIKYESEISLEHVELGFNTESKQVRLNQARPI